MKAATKIVRQVIAWEMQRAGRARLLQVVVIVAAVVALVSAKAMLLTTNANVKAVALPSAATERFSTLASSAGVESELEKLLEGKEIDLALVNWLVAADIPEFHDMTRTAYLTELNAMTEQVRQDMAKMQKVAVARGESPNDPKTRCGIFCNAIIKLRFAYNEEFRQERVTPALIRSMYADPNNICLVGLLRTRRGSCVSMPMIYLVLGQRLGMPVHLVALGRHYFIRWEERGYRMNIEPTIVEKVSVTPDDSVYLEMEGVTRDQLAGSDLRNLTRREVAGNILFARAGYWAAKGPEHFTWQIRDLEHARHLSPDDRGIAKSYQAVISQARIKAAPPGIKSQSNEKKGNSL